MTDQPYIDHLEDILEAAEKARAFTAGMSYEAFVEDEKTIFAVIRALEVIGEATKRLPEDLRARNPQIPWDSMAGMRDKLIHDYVNVSEQIVWRTVQEELPGVQRHLKTLLNDL